MTIALIPIAPEHLDGTQHLWLPYIKSISERDKCDPAEKLRKLYAAEAQAFLIWDVEAKKALAFLGVDYVLRGKERQAVLIWLAGENRAVWTHLFTDLETYLRDEQGCKSVKAIARPGWEKYLKPAGFRETHRVLEKELGDAAIPQSVMAMGRANDAGRS